jgi:hypothetical protein
VATLVIRRYDDDVSHRLDMLFAIVLCIALNLFLPAMPRAFVFEPAASSESAGIARHASLDPRPASEEPD